MIQTDDGYRGWHHPDDLTDRTCPRHQTILRRDCEPDGDDCRLIDVLYCPHPLCTYEEDA